MENQSLIEKVRFYLSDETKVAEALLLIRNTERILEEAKEKVKARAAEIMDKSGNEVISYSITDPETGEIREWEVKRDYGTQTKEYRPENVFKVLGEKAFKYFKVNKTNFDKDVSKMSAKGELTLEQVDEATKDPLVKTRKGAGVKLREIKAK